MKKFILFAAVIGLVSMLFASCGETPAGGANLPDSSGETPAGGANLPDSPEETPQRAVYSEGNYTLLGDAIDIFVGSNDQSVTAEDVVPSAGITAYEGSKVLKIDLSHTEWGGAYFGPATGTDAIDLSDYADGVIVFSINYSNISNLRYFEIKMASGSYPDEGGGIINLFSLTPSEENGNWKTYRVPVASFDSYEFDFDLMSPTSYLGFWNPKDDNGEALNGVIYVDDVYFDPTNNLALDADIPLTIFGASTVSGLADSTSAYSARVIYENGATVAANVTWSVSSSAPTDTNSMDPVATIDSASGVLTLKQSGAVTIEASTEVGGVTLTTTHSVTVTVGVPEPLILFSAEDASGLARHDWNSGSTIIEVTAGTPYTYVLKVVSGSGWGTPSACVAFTELPGGYQSTYTSIKFKIKSDDLATIYVKVPEIENSYTITEGVEQTGAEGYYEMTVPFSDFSGTELATTTAIGIHGGNDNAGTFYITDVELVP